MTITFDIDKIVKYLEKYKNNLPELYQWKPKIERLIELDTLSESQVSVLNNKSSFEKELQLKKIVGQKLKETQQSNPKLFKALCLWVVKDWGGIKTAKDDDTTSLVHEFLQQDKPNFNRIASASKVGAYMYPEKNVIYDSRVAYTLNWILLSENAGKHYFPIPEGRNSKMLAFDLNVLIRLKNIDFYHTNQISDLEQKKYINNIDSKIYINKKEAYFEMNKLVKEINKKLWKGDKEKEDNLYYTEMLLFSIADREVFKEITTYYSKNR